MEKDGAVIKSKLTTEKALQMLRSEGLNVSPKEAEEILYFLRIITNIVVVKHLKRRR